MIIVSIKRRYIISHQPLRYGKLIYKNSKETYILVKIGWDKEFCNENEEGGNRILQIEAKARRKGDKHTRSSPAPLPSQLISDGLIALVVGTHYPLSVF